MSNITEPIGKSEINDIKPLKTFNSSPIMVDGHAFKFQSEADEYIRSRNAMTPKQIKKESDDIALEKTKKSKEIVLGIIKSTAMVSVVPLGLAYFSYNQKYSLTKGIGVVVIGSGIAYFVTLAYAFRNGM